MGDATVFVGIDVSKRRLDVAFHAEAETWSVANEDPALSDLASRLADRKPLLIVLESTGGFEIPLVSALAALALPVVVVNPRQVRDFAKATGQLAKTDQIDARILALFAARVRPPIRPLPDEATQILGALMARRRQLIDMLTAEKNRLGFAPAPIRPGVQKHIDWLEQELADVDQDLDGCIRESPVWRAKDNLLRSVPGVGPNLSRTLLAEQHGCL